MSEYQYYEFIAIDKPLTEAEQNKMRKLSSRVKLTPASAAFVYNYRDFPGNAEKIFEQHFDAMLYVSSWGTRKLMFKFPPSIVNVDSLKPFHIPNMISITIKDDSVIIDINWNNEDGGGWIEGEGWLPSLSLLRQEVMKRDFRFPYLAWLKAAVEIEPEAYNNLLEPPVPPNLDNLSRPLKDFVDLFEIDKQLIKAGAQNSQKRNGPMDNDLGKCISQLSAVERDNFLVRVAKGEPNVDAQLLNRLYELASEKIGCQPDYRPRTVAEIKKAAQEESEKEREWKRKLAEEARIKEIEALKSKEPQTWAYVSELIGHKKPKSYDEAVELLINLRDLAGHLGQSAQFQSRVNELHEQYRSLSSLKARLRKAGLITQ